MYGLPQSRMIAHTNMSKILKQAEFKQDKYTPGLWTHKTYTPIVFSFVVDDFGVKYTRQEDADFLCNTLTNAGYEINTNWSGTLFRGVTTRWDYPNH